MKREGPEKEKKGSWGRGAVEGVAYLLHRSQDGRLSVYGAPWWLRSVAASAAKAVRTARLPCLTAPAPTGSAGATTPLPYK